MRFSAGSPGSSSSAGRGASSPSSADRADSTARRLVAEARVARLATIDADGRPHLVPILFALDGDTLYSAVDSKPKRSRVLRRIENARVRPDVTVLVDAYDDDWTRLWWVRLRGRARVLDGGDEASRAIALLTAKYAPYRDDPPGLPVLAIDVHDWRKWVAGHMLAAGAKGESPRCD
jgi:PPOX class probable F420-dependent enzyme